MKSLQNGQHCRERLSPSFWGKQALTRIAGLANHFYGHGLVRVRRRPRAPETWTQGQADRVQGASVKIIPEPSKSYYKNIPIILIDVAGSAPASRGANESMRWGQPGGARFEARTPMPLDCCRVVPNRCHRGHWQRNCHQAKEQLQVRMASLAWPHHNGRSAFPSKPCRAVVCHRRERHMEIMNVRCVVHGFVLQRIWLLSNTSVAA